MHARWLRPIGSLAGSTILRGRVSPISVGLDGDGVNAFVAGDTAEICDASATPTYTYGSVAVSLRIPAPGLIVRITILSLLWI